VYQNSEGVFFMGCGKEVGAVDGSVLHPVAVYMVPLKPFSQFDCPLDVRSVVLCRIRSIYIWAEKRYVLVDENGERIYPYELTEKLNNCFGKVSVFDPRNLEIMDSLAELLHYFPGHSLKKESALRGAAYLFANEFPRLAPVFMISGVLTPQLFRPLDAQMERFLELFTELSVSAFIDTYFLSGNESTSIRETVYTAFAQSWRPNWVVPWLLWFIAWRFQGLFKKKRCLLVAFLTRPFVRVPLPDDWDVFSVLLEEVVRQVSDESVDAVEVVSNLVRAMESPESGREAV